MCTYVPENLETSRPLAEAFYSCNQQAADDENETGWIGFADRHPFALLLPQEKDANNRIKGFNWFDPNNSEHDQGEALSIQQMIDKMASDILGIDQTPEVEDTINGHEHKLYKNDNDETLVETVLISGTGHGTPIDPGDGDDECGAEGPFTLDVGIYSNFYIIKFWGLDSQMDQNCMVS